MRIGVTQAVRFIHVTRVTLFTLGDKPKLLIKFISNEHASIA